MNLPATGAENGFEVLDVKDGIRRNAAGDRTKAAEFYARAVALPGAPMAAWREHGFALRDAGRKADAATALRRYLDTATQAEDRAFVQRELDRLGGTP